MRCIFFKRRNQRKWFELSDKLYFIQRIRMRKCVSTLSKV